MHVCVRVRVCGRASKKERCTVGSGEEETPRTEAPGDEAAHGEREHEDDERHLDEEEVVSVHVQAEIHELFGRLDLCPRGWFGG